MNKLDITKESLEKALETCKTRDELAIYFDSSLSTIKRRLKDYGLSTNKTPDRKKEFIKLYNDGLNDTEIAKILKVSNSTIGNYRNELNLKSNFMYKTEELRNIVLNSTGSYYEISNKLDLDIRIIEYFFNEPEKSDILTENQLQIFLGGMLGDGSIGFSKSKNRFKYVFAHSDKQKEYAIWKAKELCTLGSYPLVFNCKEHFDERTNKVYKSHWFFTRELPIFKEYFDKFYINEEGKNIKIIPKDIGNLTELGLAIWYMDDGTFENPSFIFCSQGFKYEDVEYLRKILLDKFNLKTTHRGSDEIYILSESRDHFVNLVEPYIHSSLLYKINR